MLIPFDMIAVMLYLGYYAEIPANPANVLSQSVQTLALACLGMFLSAMLINRMALLYLRRRSGMVNRRYAAGLIDNAVRVFLVGGYIATLSESGLPWSLLSAFGWQSSGESFAFQLCGLILYVLLFLCAWFPLYGLHKELNYGVWTRTSYMIHKARYNLFILAAWLPIALLTDWLSEFLVVMPLLFLGTAWSFPLLLARLWGCKKLTDAGTMAMVKRLEAKAGAGFSAVYLWEPGGGNSQNAAAVGIFRPFRYLFLTPTLIENMNTDEIEAVVLHELGHVKNKHLLFYLFASMTGISLAFVIGTLLPLSGGERFLLIALLILAYFRLAFGWLSRNMERQADLFSLEKSGKAVHLINALEKLGIAAGHIRRAASWHHSGIAERVACLRYADNEREVIRFHNSRVKAIKAVGYALAAAFIVVSTFSVWLEFPRQSMQTVTDDARFETHWRRVMQILPSNPTAPLVLAYRLSKSPDTHGEAVILATKVMRLACGKAEKSDAEKLLGELMGEPPPEIDGECDDATGH